MKRAARLLGRGVALLLASGFAYLGYIYLTLPDVRRLRTDNPSTTAFMALRAREARSEGKPFARDQRWVSYARISQHLKRAVIVTEDAAFWQHGGIDYDQLRESMEVNWERGEFARGASTITQQLAKNLYLSPSKNPVRKFKELLITRRLEAELTKQRILELYLNAIEWGDGIWGAEAAARRYFHKGAADLNAPESALLAGAIANPHIMNPAHPTARLRRRQEMIMRRMGAVTPPPVVIEPPPLIQPVEGIPFLPPVPELSVPSGVGRGGGPGQ
jgi:monofunctional biosynthetic peptidoglycan transglycosylase